MAVKNSALYAKIWSACDELRGGMDASEYKDYILVLLFIKYVSDKYAGKPYASITVPAVSSFADMRALKGKRDIGDLINTKIVAPLFAENQLSNPPDFNSNDKLGTGAEKVDRLTKLIAIFEDPGLDFSSNRPDGDDILGDAYEYLMRHFATESGKSKGNFFTPTEVSRTISQIIGIANAKTSESTTIYDPTCGSGSLLLRVADAAKTKVSIYGQEKEATTAGLARMNMILHDQENIEIRQGNTLAAPAFTEDEKLKRFDYVVANPPFSDKAWSNGVQVSDDPFGRFVYGAPPAKQGDYAYLLHILASLKSTGTGVCVMPHGVLFRGNAEAAIRENLVKQGYIAGIIGLPANLFYGTGIPACLIVLDKAKAAERKGIFMIDGSTGFMKDGPKNRLRDRDIHKIVDAFTKQLDIPRYSRFVPLSEIDANGFNLNIPRYIDSSLPEDIQDIDAHLNGGIPVADIDALERYWTVCPKLRKSLFQPMREGYVELAVPTADLKATIEEHPEFRAFLAESQAHFNAWREKTTNRLKGLNPGFHPKDLVREISEELLAHYHGNPLIDPYAVYQHLMDYWAETMQDDCYLISVDGWKAETQRVIETNKKGQTKDKGWTCELIPKEYIIRRYFIAEQGEIDDLTGELESVSSQLAELEEEHAIEGSALDLDAVKRTNVAARLKQIAKDKDSKAEAAVLKSWIDLSDNETTLKRRLKEAEAALDTAAYEKYPTLTENDIKVLVVEDMWLGELDVAIHGEMDRVGQQLTQRVGELATRYGAPLPLMTETTAALETRVNQHLRRMGFAWN